MEFLVTLYRDSLQTAWGFRLEGGRDFKAPLTIQRVFTGTPASSDLLRGDIITSIYNEDASFLFHQEANDLIRSSGGSLQLGIRRTAGAENLQFQPFQSYKHTIDFTNAYAAFHQMNEDDDASKRYRSHQIEKYKNPKPIFSQTGSSHLPTYQPFTVGECSSVQRFTGQSKTPNSNLSYTKPSYPKFSSTNHSPAPYVDRRMIGNIQQNLTRAVHAPNAHYQNKTLSMPALPKTTMKVGKYDVKQFSNATQNFSKGPSMSSNHSSSPMPSNSAKVVTKQYNSPIGLYSNNAIKEEYNKQIHANEFYNANTNSASEF